MIFNPGVVARLWYTIPWEYIYRIVILRVHGQGEDKSLQCTELMQVVWNRMENGGLG